MRSRRCADRLPGGQVERLAQALSLIFGVEVLVVLKDIWGLDSRRDAVGRAMGGRRAGAGGHGGDDVGREATGR